MGHCLPPDRKRTCMFSWSAPPCHYRLPSSSHPHYCGCCCYSSTGGKPSPLRGRHAWRGFPCTLDVGARFDWAYCTRIAGGFAGLEHHHSRARNAKTLLTLSICHPRRTMEVSPALPCPAFPSLPFRPGRLRHDFFSPYLGWCCYRHGLSAPSRLVDCPCPCAASCGRTGRLLWS